MTTTEILEITELEQSQSNRYITINNAIKALEQAMNRKLAKSTTGTTAITLSTTEATRYGYYVASGGGGNFNFVFPGEIGSNNANRLFVFKNASSYTVTVQSDTPGSTVVVPAGASCVIHQDHDDMVKLAEFDGLTVSPYDIGFYIAGQPDDAAEVFKFVAPRDIDFPDNFAGSVGHCGVNPTGTAAFDVLVNGSSIGSISINTSGTFTFNTTGGAVALSAGDRLSVTAPSPQDGTLASIAVTFKGTRDR